MMFLETFLVKLRDKGCSPNTIRSYKSALAPFLHYVYEECQEVINTEAIEKWLSQLEHSGHLRRSSLATTLAIIRSYCRYLFDEGYLNHNPGRSLKVKQAERRKRNYLTDEELRILLSFPIVGSEETLRDKAILRVLIATGILVGELVRLRREEACLGSPSPAISFSGRRVPLDIETVQAIEAYLEMRKEEPSPFLFLAKGGSPLGERTVRAIMTKYAKNAKLKKIINPTTLRNTFARTKLREGMDTREVAFLLGFKSLASVQRYFP